MKLEQLYIFARIAESKSIRIASESLFFTPQHLSKEMIAFEKELNVKLYERSHSGIRLTEEGKRAYQHISAILKDIDAFKQDFSVMEETNTDSMPVNIFSVAIMDSYASFITRDLYDLFPAAAINDRQLPREQLNQSLLSGEDPGADIILSNLRPPYKNRIHPSIKNLYHCYFLFEDLLCLQVPRSSPYADLEEIPMSLLARLPLIMFVTDFSRKTEFEEILESAGCKLTNVSKNSNLDTCSKIALRAGKYCLVGYPSVESRPLPNCEYIPIENHFTLHQLLFVRKKPANPRAVQAFQQSMDDLFNLQKVF